MTKISSYATYRDSGVEWLGSIPAHWSVTKFRHCFRESSEVNGKEIVGEMLSVSGFRGVEAKVYEDENQKRDADQLESYRVVRKGQLAVNTMWLNYSGLGISNYDGHMSPAYRAYWVTRAANLRYIHHLMRSRTYVDGYTSFLTGIRPNSLQMGRANLMDFPIILPPSKEQDAIAAFLDRETVQIDGLIAKQERLIELLVEKRQAVITHAVTKGLDPNAPTKPSGVPWLGQIPTHWTKSRLKWTRPIQESGTSVNGMDIPAGSDEIGVLKTGAVSKGYFVPEANKTVVPEDIDRVTCPVRGGTLIVNRANTPDLVGTTGRTTCDAPSLFLSDKLWQIDFEWADTNFIYWWSKTDVYRSQIQFRRVGASSSMQNLSYPDFLTVDIALPSLEEQQIIARYIDRRTASIDLLESRAQEAIVLLRERRSALISAAVTGKIDVREGASKP